MRKCFQALLMVVLISFLGGRSGDCSADGSISLVDNLLDPAAIEEIIPGSLAEYLFDRGIHMGRFKPALKKNGKQNIYLFESDFQDMQCILLQLSDGRVIVLVDDRTDAGGMLIKFDSGNDTFVALEAPPDCIKEISSAIQALLSAAHNCADNPRPFKCAEDIVDFFTRIYLIFVECGSSQDPES